MNMMAEFERLLKHMKEHTTQIDPKLKTWAQAQRELIGEGIVAAKKQTFSFEEILKSALNSQCSLKLCTDNGIINLTGRLTKETNRQSWLFVVTTKSGADLRIDFISSQVEELVIGEDSTQLLTLEIILKEI